MHELIFRYSLHCHQNYSNKKFLQRNMPNYTPEIPVKPRPFIKLQKHTFCFRKWQWQRKTAIIVCIRAHKNFYLHNLQICKLRFLFVCTIISRPKITPGEIPKNIMTTQNLYYLYANAKFKRNSRKNFFIFLFK